MLKKEFGGTWREEKVNWKSWEGGTTRVKLEETSGRSLVENGRQRGVGYKTAACCLGICLM